MDSSKQDAISLDSGTLDTPATNPLDRDISDTPHIRADRAHVVFRPSGHGILVPRLIADLGDDAAKRFLEFFAANIRNKNTRAAYARAVGQFLAWCEHDGCALRDVEPIHVATYVERQLETKAKPTVKQHLAALRMLFDWLVTGQVLDANPATSVRGPKHVVRKGKTHVLDADDARTLLDSIPLKFGPEPKPGEIDDRPPSLIGLRDRALIAVMVFSFARVSAVLGMKVDDYYPNGKRWWLRLHEKGGKFHEVPAHHLIEEYLDAYIQAAKIKDDGKGWLFRSAIGKSNRLTDKPLNRHNAFHMVKRRAKAAGVSSRICNHTFRATGITVYLSNKGTLEKAQHIAAHESPKTTKLYDRTSDAIDLGEIEKIII
jgi:site-specific recombinase XerD